MSLGETGAKRFHLAAVLCLLAFPASGRGQVPPRAGEVRVVVESRGWQLVGDLRVPGESDEPCAAVLMLNKAAGDRSVYRALAAQLADRGIASLRLDLPGHGESTNLDRFVPGESSEQARETMIWESDRDVTAAQRFLAGRPGIDPNRIGIVGASYSGEEMAEAGRLRGRAQAYVALSPGSFSDESIRDIDASGVPWLFVASREERHLQEITAAVQERSRTVEMILLPGTEHATNILVAHAEIAERIAVWLASRLR